MMTSWIGLFPMAGSMYQKRVRWRRNHLLDYLQEFHARHGRASTDNMHILYKLSEGVIDVVLEQMGARLGHYTDRGKVIRIKGKVPEKVSDWQNPQNWELTFFIEKDGEIKRHFFTFRSAMLFDRMITAWFGNLSFGL